MADIYGGAIPTNGFTGYPGSASDKVAVGETPGAGGQGRIDAKPGTAPEMNSSYAAQTDGNFVDDASYGSSGDMSVDNDPKMVVRNPDDLSHADSGKMP